MLVMVSTGVDDLAVAGVVPARGERIDVALVRARVAARVTSARPLTVSLDASGNASWVAESGDVLRIDPHIRGLSQFYALVPAVEAVTLSELFLSHQVEKGSWSPVATPSPLWDLALGTLTERVQAVEDRPVVSLAEGEDGVPVVGVGAEGVRVLTPEDAGERFVTPAVLDEALGAVVTFRNHDGSPVVGKRVVVVLTEDGTDVAGFTVEPVA